MNIDDYETEFAPMLGDLYDSDPLAPARGCLIGSLLGLAFWSLVYVIVRRFA